jgi:hypothetical protein
VDKVARRPGYATAILLAAAVSFALLPVACTPATTSSATAAATPTPTSVMTPSSVLTPSSAPTLIATCDRLHVETVGPYVIEANYWDQSCPGTQCMVIDPVTGAFTVTQFPDCGMAPASFPNALYGCSWGICSPGSTLPKQVSALTSATSSWSFSVGGVASDKWNVAYDLWFCPDTNCGTSGFPGGAELMIWLDYQNVGGWLYDQGPANLAGRTWEVWTGTQGSGASAWTYLAYLIAPPMVTSVADLDLMAFINDAKARGYVLDSQYLYAIQAGIELRTGGIPYEHHSFSASVP